MATREQKSDQESRQQEKPKIMDAVRHVGPTLESEGVFIPTGELPENRIEEEGLTETANVDAMGAEPLKTRLPGDRSSDPHTDVGPTNATALDDDRKRSARGNGGRAA